MCDVKMKTCNECKRELPSNYDYFFKKRDTVDGFAKKCKECQEYAFTTKLSKLPKENHKFCIKCDRELPSTVQYFPPDKTTKGGIRNVCRECGKDRHFMDDGYIPKTWWTKEDEDILVKVYPHYLNDELIELYFPNRTTKDICDKVYRMNSEQDYNIEKTSDTTKRRYKMHSEKMSGENSPFYGVPKTEEHKKKLSDARRGKFVGENSYWYGKKRTDENRLKLSKIRKEMGLWSGKRNPRYANPLMKDKNGRWKGGVSELHVHLRRFIKPWKDDSMKNCNYKCVITGGDFNNIHHLYNFSYILDKTIKVLNLPIHESINKYSHIDLKLIEETCLQFHYEHGLGVCLRKDIHKLFHDLYGYSNNDPNQFEEFKLRYRMGEFDILNKYDKGGLVYER